MSPQYIDLSWTTLGDIEYTVTDEHGAMAIYIFHGVPAQLGFLNIFKLRRGNESLLADISEPSQEAQRRRRAESDRRAQSTGYADNSER